MNILLIRPKPSKDTIGLQNVMICEPLELEYLVSNLKLDNHNTNIIDMIIEKKDIGVFIKKYKPDVVGITSYISHVGIVKEYAKKIKGIDKEIKVVVGGVHAEVVPEDFQDDNIDYIITANGIDTFKNILKLIEKSSFGKENVEGVYGGKLTKKKNTFTYEFPDRKSVNKYRKKYYYMFHNPCALMKTSFGCPYQCKFCFCRRITDDNYFSRDVEDIIDELITIPEKEIYIVDDNFLFNKDKLMKFCALIKDKNINKKFLVYGRADFIAQNEGIIKELSECGLRAVIVGLESSKEDELNEYNKKSDVELNEKAVKVLQKYNIECYGTLILGIDWDEKDFNDLYKWIRKIDLKFVNLQPFTPLTGTELYEEYKDRIIIPREQFEKWDLANLVIKPTKISIKKYYWYIIKLYYKILMNPKTVFYIIKKYGLGKTLKLSLGSSKITMQYLKKIISNN